MRPFLDWVTTASISHPNTFLASGSEEAAWARPYRFHFYGQPSPIAKAGGAGRSHSTLS